MSFKRTVTLTWHYFSEDTPREEWKIFVKQRDDDDASMFPGWVHDGKLVSPEYSFNPVKIQPEWCWFYASDLDGGYPKKTPQFIDYPSLLVPSSGKLPECDEKVWDDLKRIANEK
jgi:hypothetical protein